MICFIASLKSRTYIRQAKTTEKSRRLALFLDELFVSSRVSKPLAGHFAKAGVEAGGVLKEFVVGTDDLGRFKPGDRIGVDIFSVGQKIDVTGRSIGKGFQGGIKRHNFGSQRASHGNSVSHNAPGSIGMNQDPGRVFPGKKMSGHMGDAKQTQQNLEVIRVDVDRLRDRKSVV